MPNLALPLILAAGLVAAAAVAQEAPPRAAPESRPVSPQERRAPEPSRSWEREAERRVVPRERPERPSSPPHGGAPFPSGRAGDGWHAPGASPPPRPPAYHRVRQLPPGAHAVSYRGERYWFADGVWYLPQAGGYLVTRPPLGVVAPELPVHRTIVRLGGLTLYLVNDTYYRPLAGGGYEVVAPPQAAPGARTPRPLIQPRRGQSPEQQARDEYECHRWATRQSGHDPLQQPEPPEAQKADDYRRAQAACLEVQGYSVH